jgi:Arc/MetJ-type ribon-helix-helix transcriptional regulator
MTSIAVRLSEETVAALDDLVAAGAYPNRSAAVRGAIDLLVTAREQVTVDRSVIESYGSHPQTDDEVAYARAATKALIEEEPW